MKSKSKIYLLFLGLLIIIVALVACGRTSMPGDQEFTVPHGTGLGLSNCLVCHAGGETAINLDLAFHQINPTNEDCLIPGCHAEGTSTLGDGKYTTPHELTGFYEDCLLCHYSDVDNPYGMPADPIHAVGNELCSIPGCHPEEGTIPTPTTTPPTTTTTTTPPTTTTTTPPPTTTTTTPPMTTTNTTTTTTPPTTTITTPPVTTTTTTATTEPPVSTTPAEAPQLSAENHPGIQDASLCVICHRGPAAAVYGETPADHEGRADDSCLDADCHTLP